jgi:hypothetical protein
MASSKVEFKFKDDWKKALIYLSLNDVLVIPRSKYYEGDEYIHPVLNICQLWPEKTGHLDFDSDEGRCAAARIVFYFFEKLHDYGVVNIRFLDLTGNKLIGLEYDSSVDLNSVKYSDVVYFQVSVNAKGLETILKLQEHEDNQERFQQQIIISNQLKNNSRGALFVSCLAVFIGFFMLWNANEMKENQKKFIKGAQEISNRQIEIAKRQLELAKKRMIILKKSSAVPVSEKSITDAPSPTIEQLPEVKPETK